MAPILQDSKGDCIVLYIEMFQEEWGDWDWIEEYFDTSLINYETLDGILFRQQDNVQIGISILFQMRKIRTWMMKTSSIF